MERLELQQVAEVNQEGARRWAQKSNWQEAIDEGHIDGVNVAASATVEEVGDEVFNMYKAVESAVVNATVDAVADVGVKAAINGEIDEEVRVCGA